MNSRQRVQLALAHQEPDHVPFDLGGTVLSSIQIQAYQRLRNFLGLGGQPEIMHVVQQIAVIDDDLRALWGADVRNVASRDAASFRLEKHESDGYSYFHDEWGAGWRMPKEGGLYFDLFDSPLAKIQSPADLERLAWPDATDPARYEGLRQRARHAVEVEGQAVFLDGLCAGIMEMSSWLRGFENFYSDLAFWGGGVDTQSVLPYGTPQQVREEDKRRIGDLAPGGGFVFAPVHNIQSDVPAENIVAMWEAWQTYGTYPI